MFDPEATARKLEAFLASRLPNASSVSVADCVPMTGGYSCLMTRFTATVDGEARQLVARSDGPAGLAVLDTDRVREWRVLSALTALGTVPMPRALFADEDGSELGAKTLIIEYAAGGSFLNKIRAAAVEQHPAFARELCDLAARFHSVDIDRIGPALDHPQDWNAYLDGLIASWRDVERQLKDSYPLLRYMAAWLDANRPPPAPFALVHGEFQPSNQVLDTDGALMAVDFEFVHIGDPREDLGWAKWVEAVQPPVLIGLDDSGFCSLYRDKTGLTEQVVNPLTIAYFSILPAMRVFSGVLRSQQAFCEGTNNSLQVAYLVGAVTTAFEGWFNAAGAIESAGKSAAEVLS